MRRRSFVMPFVVVAGLLSTSVAGGAPPRRPPSDRALDLFEQSAAAYREGKFEVAVDKLLEARRLKPEPVLLYNLARAYEALGRLDDAASAYEQYLVEEPHPADRGAIEGRISSLRAQIAALAVPRVEPEVSRAPETTTPPDTAHAPTPPEKNSGGGPTLGVAFWGITGAGLAIAGTGVGFGVVAQGDHDKAAAEPEQRRAADLQDGAETLASVATIMIVTGAVIAAAGVVWGVVRMTTARSATTTTSSVRSLIAGPSIMRWTF